MNAARRIKNYLPSGVRCMASRLKRRFVGRAAILMYHRIADLPTDPQLLAVTAQHFSEHLEVIRSRYCPIRLGELAGLLEKGRVPRRAIVVTMDDGYADNLHAACPLLERHGVPATIFVASGYVGSARQFWWDELESMVLRPGSLPPRLHFTAGGRSRRYDVGMDRYGDDDYARHRAWHVECAEDPTARHGLYRRLYHDLYPLPAEERVVALDELRACTGPRGAAGSGDHPLTVDELIELGRSPLVDIGAHSVTHVVLPLLPPPAQRREIRESRRQLEQFLGRPVTTFGYPHGCVTHETAQFVQQAGFTCASGSETDVVTRRSDRYRLPRMLVRDWDGEELARRLHGWLDA
jgi:peptidoglycan/xylan/chitin deacetylase (PgdA/CDA1 family)